MPSTTEAAHRMPVMRNICSMGDRSRMPRISDEACGGAVMFSGILLADSRLGVHTVSQRRDHSLPMGIPQCYHRLTSRHAYLRHAGIPVCIRCSTIHQQSTNNCLIWLLYLIPEWWQMIKIITQHICSISLPLACVWMVALVGIGSVLITSFRYNKHKYHWYKSPAAVCLCLSISTATQYSLPRHLITLTN